MRIKPRRGFALTCCITLMLALCPVRAAEPPVSMTYMFSGGSSVYSNQIAQAQGNIDQVNIDCFALNTDGSLKITVEPDERFIAEMHKQGITVIPYLSNHWSREDGRAALANAPALIEQMAGYIERYNLDGLDVDLQNLTGDDRAAFTAFIRALRKRLPGKLLSTCVAANPYGWTTGWQAQYDYAALAASSDCLFIMTYDESYHGGPPGPVASYQFIEKSIQYALQYTTADKLMVGIPFYGRYWIGGKGGNALVHADIVGLCEKYGAKQWYDEDRQCARATLTLPVKITSGLWGNAKLEPGVYDIWYDNERSWEKKLGLARKYGLRGIGLWALGYEQPSIWGDYYRWLKGLTFRDTEGHWAAAAIEELYGAGIVAGKSKTIFAPNDTLTRAEACAMICRMAAMEPLDAADAPPEYRSHWAAGYLLRAQREGIMMGDSSGRMQPNRAMTRAELAAVIARTLHVPGTVNDAQQAFVDVPPSHWAARDILLLKVYGVIIGTPDGRFRPGKTVTRAEAAQMLQRAMRLPADKGAPLAEPYIAPR